MIIPLYLSNRMESLFIKHIKLHPLTITKRNNHIEKEHKKKKKRVRIHLQPEYYYYDNEPPELYSSN